MAIRKPHHHQSNTDNQPEVEVVAISLDPFLDPAAEAEYQAAAEASQRAQQRREWDTLNALAEAQHVTSGEIAAANTRAARLLGLFGAALAGALVLASRATPASTFSEVVLAAAIAPLLGSVGSLLSVLYARLDTDHGFPRWALYSNQPDALADYLTLPGHRAIHLNAAQLGELAALAVSKYRRINAAVALLGAALVLLTLAVLTA